jgi:hypothetical protein
MQQQDRLAGHRRDRSSTLKAAELGKACLQATRFNNLISGIENPGDGIVVTCPSLEPPVADNPFVRPLQPLSRGTNATEQPVNPTATGLLGKRGSIFSGIELGSKQAHGKRKQ